MSTKPNLKPVNDETFNSFLDGLNLHQEHISPDLEETKDTTDEKDKTENKKEENKKEENKNNVLKNNEIKFSMQDLEEDEDQNDPIIINTANNKGNVKTVSTSKEKPAENTDFNSLIKELYAEDLLIPFDDEVDGDDVKPFEIKNAKDLKELIKANKDEWKRQVLEEEFEEEFNMLPSELQLLVDYVKKGGTDVKGVLKELSLSQEIRGLDPTKDTKEIVRQYLSLTTELNQDEIEEQIGEWVDLELIDKKANAFKPKLDTLREKKEKEILKSQEDYLEKQRKLASTFTSGLQTALKDKELNGLKISPDEKQEVFKALTENSYKSTINGNPLNFLGKYLEEIAWEKPDYKKLAELTLFAKDPIAYREKIKASVKEEVTSDIERKLRSNTSNLKTNVDQTTGRETTVTRKVISRGGGLLKRNF